MSFTATANFADALAGHGSTSLDNVFHAAIINNGISTNGINIWSINGSDSIKKPLRSAATEEQLAICEVFPETHAPVLVDAWKQLRCANALLPPPRTKFLVVNRRSAAAQPRLGPTPRQSNSAVVGGGWESAEIKEQRRREYLKPLQEAGWTDNILEQMKQLLFSSSSIPPTLVLNDDDELQMVMPDFSGQKENVSKVPVLVSLQRHGEEYSNSNRSAGMVPIENTNGALVAYSVHGTIVRIIQEQGKRKFSCTHCCGSKCSHARDATKYANQYGVGCINGDCLDGTKDGDDDRHKYLQLKDEHYHLPTGLTWPKSPYVADAIQRLLFNGKSVFKDRVRGVGYALAPQAGGPCSCVGGYYDSGSYEFVSNCSVFMERSVGCLKLPVYKLHCSNKNPACCKRHLEQYHAAGMSPAVFYSCVLEYEYHGPYEDSKPNVDLFSENTWRQALFLFLCSLRNASTVPTLGCPHCRNCPESLIVDGTSLTMQGDRFSGHPINAVLEEAEIVRQKHNTNSRAFFNVLEDRKDLNRIAQGYAKAIKAIEDTRLSTLPKLSDCDKKLEEKAGSFGLDLALKWVDEKVQAKQLTNLDRKVI
ncbi:hypothetical protein NADE_008158 [Nannochloris sp. 'desiccata']|nr:hypothetical protein NADE_008158 [Chlorella desiccata (nom. nud.)]